MVNAHSIARLNQPACIYQLLAAQAQHTPDSIALLAPGRVPLTYSRFLTHIEYMAKTLNELGLGRNSRVAIVLPNGVDTATTVLGVAASATSAPLNPTYTEKEFDFYLSDLKAQALIVQSGSVSPAIAVAQRRNISIIELSPLSEAGTFILTGAQRTGTVHGGFAEPADIAIVLHTSGTTARPKLVPLTHSNICASAYNTNIAFELSSKDRCLNVMPLFHVHGLISATLASLSAGASVVCPPGFDAYKFFAWIEEFRPTWYTGSPAIHQSVLIQASEPENQQIIERCPLRFVRASSSSLPPQMMNKLESVFRAPVIEYYGMTEASSQITSNPMPPRERKIGSAGIAAGPEVAVVDEAGNSLPPMSTGEVVIRGTNIMQGYEDNPEANASTFTNGWLRTGDGGFLDSDGYLFITGRLKERINRGGEKISPREVDEVLLDHPAIAEAVTFGVPHPTLSEDVVAAVVLRTDTIASESEIREFAFTRLADYKVPSQILIVHEIPKGPTGKPLRIGLAEKLASQLQESFVAPANDTEAMLAHIWSEVLNLKQVGRNGNFFTLGGDSLLATVVVSRVRTTFQIALPLEAIFRKPTIAELATVVEEMLLAAIQETVEGENAKTSSNAGAEDPASAINDRLYILPNGMVVASQDQLQADQCYREIFEKSVYGRQGIVLKESSCILDVGANIGLFALWAHQICKDACVYAFEPAPPLLELLNINTVLYNANVKPFACGLSSESGEAALTFYPHKSDHSTFSPDKNAEDADEHEIFQCPLRTCSDILREFALERVDLLKIDAQKSELAVLAGIEELDWEKIQQIVIKTHDKADRREQIIAVLRKRGYQVSVEQDDLVANLHYIYALQSS